MVNQPQPPLLEIQNLKKYFSAQRGFIRRQLVTVKAVDDVNLQVQAGETLGIVGESGSGKTTLGRCITRLYEPTGGKVYLNDAGGRISVTELEGEDLKRFRRKAQTIFQDPYSSLNPRMNVLQTVGEPLLVNKLAKGKELEERVTETILQVGLRVEHLQRYPHSFSGGQRQRIGIARALVLQPEVIVADEPVSALDVSIQAQVLNLLIDLQQKYRLTYLFISHAMSVVRYISDRIAVMYAGKLVELGPKTELLEYPRHPYTEVLLAAVPRTAQRHRGKRNVTPGEPPDLANLPKGCVFVPRCKYAQDICRAQAPELRQVGTNLVSCHFAESLHLQGIKFETT
ncbi:MAG: Oligopeptide transport ATP-binding protein OppF [Chloroflexi bacterium ADurb.Bin325]|nr:MAG: Oligopeptide transport ATP-binding protein OppF [Chloroflexi bacterium ADurb.Bin325]